MKPIKLKTSQSGSLRPEIIKSVKGMNENDIYLAMMKALKGDEKAVKHCLDWACSEKNNGTGLKVNFKDMSNEEVRDMQVNGYDPIID